jgi:hypothetical protein
VAVGFYGGGTGFVVDSCALGCSVGFGLLAHTGLYTIKGAFGISEIKNLLL